MSNDLCFGKEFEVFGEMDFCREIVLCWEVAGFGGENIFLSLSGEFDFEGDDLDFELVF